VGFGVKIKNADGAIVGNYERSGDAGDVQAQFERQFGGEVETPRIGQGPAGS